MKMLLGLAGLAGAMMLPAVADAATLYDATTTAGSTQTGVVHYLQQLTLAPQSGPGTYSLTSFVLGVNNVSTTATGLVVSIYSGANTSTAAADVLAGATLISSLAYNIAAPATTGNLLYTLTPATAITTTASTLFVEFALTDSSFGFYSNSLNARLSAGSPTIGSAPGFVWNDANLDNVFTGAEQTRFGATSTAVRFSATGTFAAAAVPEPATWAMLIGGFGLTGGAMRRRKAVTRLAAA